MAQTHDRATTPASDDAWAPFTYRPAVQRRADRLLDLMLHPATGAAERAVAARRFVMVTAAMPAADRDEAPYPVYVEDDGVTVECESGGAWVACDPTDPLSVAEAVRKAGAVPRYWRGQMRAAYPVRKSVAA